MQISFYKHKYRGPGETEQQRTSPDTYYNITNVTIFTDGTVLFSHTRNGKVEFLMCNLQYKLVGSEEELNSVRRGV